MTRRDDVLVNGKPRGKIARMPNDHPPSLDIQDGGSNMRMVFEDGTSVPCEAISAFGVQR